MSHQPSGSPKTILVLGASYAGNRAAQLLAAGVPSGWRVVVIERNTHFNHLYAFPRIGVLPGHEHKTFIPYSNIFGNPTHDAISPHRLIHGTLTDLTPHSATYTSLDDPRHQGSVSFDYLIYALGSHLPAPIDVWALDKEASNCPTVPMTPLETPTNLWEPTLIPSGTKPEGCRFMRKQQAQISAASSVLIIGGGPLGLQYASDIKDLYPGKEVTLVHSRARLLPRFDEYLHYAAIKKLEELGVKVVLGSRVNVSSIHAGSIEKDRQLETCNGTKVGAELVLVCTGQIPNTSFLARFSPESINPLNGAAYITRTMQLADPPVFPTPPATPDISLVIPLPPSPGSDNGFSEEDYFGELSEEPEEDEEDLLDESAPQISLFPHIFVVGDASDAFGALKAGHTAWDQAGVAANNVLAMIHKKDSEAINLQEYFAPPFLIKVSLGFKHAIFQSRDVCGTRGEAECTDLALNSHLMWTRRGLSTDDMTI